MSKQPHRSRYTDIAVILGSLVVVGGAISMVHSTKKEIVQTHQTNIDTDATDNVKNAADANAPELSSSDNASKSSADIIPLLPPPPTTHAQEPVESTKTVVTKSNEALRTYIAPLIAANNVQDIADILKGNTIDKVAQLTDAIISDKKSLLGYTSKVQLILALALNYTSLAEQSMLFDIFLAHQQLFLAKSPPILFIAATDLLDTAIPSLLGWAKIKEAEYPDLQNKIVKSALSYTVSNNSPDRLGHMIANGVPINSKQATELLWAVVMGNKKADFMPLLKECAANFDDIKNKSTPLIAAITNNNKELVQALLDNGASIGFMPSPDTGSPLQQAIVQKRTDIELLLRSRGAKE